MALPSYTPEQQRIAFAKEAAKAGAPNSLLALIVLLAGAMGFASLVVYGGEWIDSLSRGWQALLFLPYLLGCLAGLLGVWLIYGAAMDFADSQRESTPGESSDTYVSISHTSDNFSDDP